MDRFARLSASERALVFRETAARAGFGSPTVVEKDFWVCWTLRRLYALENVPALLFKGGTSLSKCFGLIERFSEDIDIGLERGGLDLGDEADPSNKVSRKARTRAANMLREATREYISRNLLPLVRRRFSEALDREANIALDPADDETILFRYPVAGGPSAPSRYLDPVVRIELGSRSDHYPTRAVSIEPYVAKQFPDEFDDPRCEVIAQAPERTLIEKALILHSHRNPKDRVSRHLYDLSRLFKASVHADLTRELVRSVAKHKRDFADDRLAGEAPDSGFGLIREGELLQALRRDYGNMREMFFGDPPPFEELMDDLRALERHLNEMMGRQAP